MNANTIFVIVAMAGAILAGLTGAYFENREFCKESNISWWRFVTLRWRL